MMSKYRRWVFTAAAAVSFLLCLIALGVWYRSYRTVTDIGWESNGAMRNIVSAWGAAEINFSMPLTQSHRAGDPGSWYRTHPAEDSDRLSGEYSGNIVGFAYDHRVTSFASTHSFLLPDWFLALVTAILPALWLGRAMELFGRRTYCQNCGCAFRNPDNRCPNCGTVWM
jgi:hypothetical protein